MTTRRVNAFTLAEILVVAVLLAIIGALLVPRLAGKPRLTTQLAAEQVAELLATLAFRSSLSAQPVALMRGLEDGALEIWVLDMDPERPDLPAAWRRDRFSRPLRLPEGVALTAVRFDEKQYVPDDDWSITCTPGQPRPRIELALSGDATEVSVVLEPRASAPFIVQPGSSNEILRTSIDLDREGREREIW
ncbi:MAG: type II secretion system protein [Phycisphaerae bacterium]|nr:type II secretion system protein [Phycisphaerae bacterium]